MQLQIAAKSSVLSPVKHKREVGWTWHSDFAFCRISSVVAFCDTTYWRCVVADDSVRLWRSGVVKSSVWRHDRSVRVPSQRGPRLGNDPQQYFGRHALLAVQSRVLRTGVRPGLCTVQLRRRRQQLDAVLRVRRLSVQTDDRRHQVHPLRSWLLPFFRQRMHVRQCCPDVIWDCFSFLNERI